MVIATTSQRHMLGRMGLNDAFDSEFEVPLITRVDTIGFVLKVNSCFSR